MDRRSVIDLLKTNHFIKHIPEKSVSLVIEEANKYIDYPWQAFLATEYIRFTQDGNRSLYENKYFHKRSALGWLVLASFLTNDTKYIADVINGIYSVCEESNWVVPAHNQQLAHCENNILGDPENIFIDLFAAETGSLLSFTYYLLHEQLEQISPLITKRICHELKVRIIQPYLNTDDFWWMGFVKNTREVHHLNNWNPWCLSNCLMTLLLVEDDKLKLDVGVAKCIQSFELYLNGQPNDGGCDEGATYWGHAVGSILILADFLYFYSHGEIDYYNNDKIRKMAEYIYKAHIDTTYFLPFADCDVKNNNLADELIYQFGKLLSHSGLIDLAIMSNSIKTKKLESEKWFPMYRMLNKLILFDKLNMPPKPSSHLCHDKDIWFNEIEVMCSRAFKQTNKGLYIAAKGHHNHESHNHNDVGNFVVYLDGLPMIIDVGVETYTKETFSNTRYKIWTMQSSFHNLPSINGYQQNSGLQYKSEDVFYQCDENRSIFSLNIHHSYPEAAGIKKWRREFVHDRIQQKIIIMEQFDLFDKTNNITLNYITNNKPINTNDGRIVIRNHNGSSLVLFYPKSCFKYQVIEIPIADQRLLKSWQGIFYKIELILINAVSSASWQFTITEENKNDL